MLEAWAAADPGTPDEGLTVKQEIKAIHEAMVGEDEEFGVALSGPMGVALVLIYPCGKAQKQPPRSGAESTETDL